VRQQYNNLNSNITSISTPDWLNNNLHVLAANSINRTRKLYLMYTDINIGQGDNYSYPAGPLG
jgi:hypothetical protein